MSPYSCTRRAFVTFSFVSHQWVFHQVVLVFHILRGQSTAEESKKKKKNSLFFIFLKLAVSPEMEKEETDLI